MGGKGKDGKREGSEEAGQWREGMAENKVEWPSQSSDDTVDTAKTDLEGRGGKNVESGPKKLDDTDQQALLRENAILRARCEKLEKECDKEYFFTEQAETIQRTYEDRIERLITTQARQQEQRRMAELERDNMQKALDDRHSIDTYWTHRSSLESATPVILETDFNAADFNIPGASGQIAAGGEVENITEAEFLMGLLNERPPEGPYEDSTTMEIQLLHMEQSLNLYMDDAQEVCGLAYRLTGGPPTDLAERIHQLEVTNKVLAQEKEDMLADIRTQEAARKKASEEADWARAALEEERIKAAALEERIRGGGQQAPGIGAGWLTRVLGAGDGSGSQIAQATAAAAAAKANDELQSIKAKLTHEMQETARLQAELSDLKDRTTRELDRTRHLAAQSVTDRARLTKLQGRYSDLYHQQGKLSAAYHEVEKRRNTAIVRLACEQKNRRRLKKERDQHLEKYKEQAMARVKQMAESKLQESKLALDKDPLQQPPRHAPTSSGSDDLQLATELAEPAHRPDHVSLAATFAYQLSATVKTAEELVKSLIGPWLQGVPAEPKDPVYDATGAVIEPVDLSTLVSMMALFSENLLMHADLPDKTPDFGRTEADVWLDGMKDWTLLSEPLRRQMIDYERFRHGPKQLGESEPQGGEQGREEVVEQGGEERARGQQGGPEQGREDVVEQGGEETGRGKQKKVRQKRGKKKAKTLRDTALRLLKLDPTGYAARMARAAGVLLLVYTIFITIGTYTSAKKERKMWLAANGTKARAYLIEYDNQNPYAWWFPVDVDLRFFYEPWLGAIQDWLHGRVEGDGRK